MLVHSSFSLCLTAGTCRLEACSLCEECPVSIMLRPCGHVTLCHVCGARAKRCMNKECRVSLSIGPATLGLMYLYCIGDRLR